MSIANELSRLLQAKSDLATSITNKGVTVPAATTLDGYAALVDQIQQGGGTLPYDSKIEYLEATGTQWIDTGILYQIGMSIHMNAVCTDRFTETQILAAPSASGACWLGALGYKGGSFGFGSSDSTVIGRSNVRTSMTWTYYSTRSLITGNNASIFVNRTTNPTTSPIYLFGCNGRFLASARIYSCQIHDGDNNVLADFIPVRVGQVGYLYDRISGTLFGNSGTGSFVLGPDVT